MIPIGGSSSLLGLKITDATRAGELERLATSGQHARAIDSFRTRIRDVETVDQLMADFELYSFVMRAFDLEDQIFGKAMIEQILKSNKEEKGALITKMTDARFREMYDTLGFGVDGVGNVNTALNSWREKMVDRYLGQLHLNDVEAQNPIVAAALTFREKAPDVDGPFDILKDAQMTDVMRVVLGLPDQMAQLDVDRQARILTEKYDLSRLKDPEEVERLLRRYTVIKDALTGANVASNPVVTMMAGAVSAGRGVVDPISIDITRIPAAYRKVL